MWRTQDAVYDGRQMLGFQDSTWIYMGDWGVTVFPNAAGENCWGITTNFHNPTSDLDIWQT
jgi:hypothetical protein